MLNVLDESVTKEKFQGSILCPRRGLNIDFNAKKIKWKENKNRFVYVYIYVHMYVCSSVGVGYGIALFISVDLVISYIPCCVLFSKLQKEETIKANKPTHVIYHYANSVIVGGN